MFVNSASMQEINPEIIEKYFEYMRKSSSSTPYFYCCNRIKKSLPDGTVVEFFNFPWRDEDDILIDELCPWYQKGPVPGILPPYWMPFDGPIQHRFLKLASDLFSSD